MGKASVLNPRLQDMQILIGEWKTSGRHPMLPGAALQGHASFQWLEGGAFIIMHTSMDDPRIPAGIAIFGTDDDTGECYMLYFDERKVSRRYMFSFHDNIWKWWRDSPAFAQRFTVTLSPDGNTMTGNGQLCRDGKNWENDLQLVYERI